MKNKQQGFTLVELIVVIIILGILAASALPKFMDYRRDAQIAALKSVAGSVASATQLNYSKWYAVDSRVPADIRKDKNALAEYLKGQGITYITGCLGGNGDKNTEAIYSDSNLNGLMSSNGTDIVFGTVANEGGSWIDSYTGNFAKNAKFVIGMPGLSGSNECFDGADKQFETIQCPVYLSEKFTEVKAGGCYEDNYCVWTKVSCLTGRPSNGINKSGINVNPDYAYLKFDMPTDITNPANDIDDLISKATEAQTNANNSVTKFQSEFNNGNAEAEVYLNVNKIAASQAAAALRVLNAEKARREKEAANPPTP